MRKGRKLEALIGLAIDRVNSCLATLRRDLFIMTAKNTLVSSGRFSASVMQGLCGVQLWVPSPPALAKEAVMVGTWHRGQPVLISGYLRLLRPRVKV